MSYITHRKHFDDWKQACVEIKNKAEYRKYPMRFSILSDFSDDDLNSLMDLGVTYSGYGSYTEGEEIQTPTWTGNIISRDLCAGAEQYSTSNSNSTSWASALIMAAENALIRAGYNEQLSLPYVLKCLPESQEIGPNEVTPSDIMTFVSEKGLMSEAVATQLQRKEYCSASVPKYYFEFTRNDIPNKSGLMNFIGEGNPVMVLLALDLVRLKTVNDVTGDDIYTGAAYQPSIYGVIRGYDEKKWSVMFNVVPCENIEMNLPMADNETSANYAGIAGYAMSIKLKAVPPKVLLYDVQRDLDIIPNDISDLRFEHEDPSDVQELNITYPYLRSLSFGDYTFPNVMSFFMDCPIINYMYISDLSFSQNAMRRLMDLNGYFVLNTPNLMLMTVGTQSLLNFLAMSVTQISSNFTLELGAYSMSNVERVEYKVEISMDVLTQIQTTIEKNEGHSGTLELVPINPVVTATPTPTPTPVLSTVSPSIPTTEVPTTLTPTTLAPTTLAPTTMAPTTEVPTTMEPTTEVPTTMEPTTMVPTTMAPTTETPTTETPTTEVPTTMEPITMAPTTLAPTTMTPTTEVPTTEVPTTLAPTTEVPTTETPTTETPTTEVPTTMEPTTVAPTTEVPTTETPTTETPITQTPTPTPSFNDPELVSFSIERHYGDTPDISENMIIYYGYSEYEFLSLSYDSQTIVIINGTVAPQLMRIYMEGINNGWKNDSYFVIHSEFGSTDRISLSEAMSSSIFFHFSYGVIPETVVTNCEEYNSINSSAKILHIAENACNDKNVTAFSTAALNDLIYLEIDSWNFRHTNTFDIRNNNKLEYVYVKSNSFVERYSRWSFSFDIDSSASFSVVNCGRLKSLEIAGYSFGSYGGIFKLTNLPLLESITIGYATAESHNFNGTSLVIRGSL